MRLHATHLIRDGGSAGRNSLVFRSACRLQVNVKTSYPGTMSEIVQMALVL